ncbi:hypothetical protein KR067_012306 [Drosophila pandora]|nr:hypothetical protein KR067_012306 [Drosophila pandora]
MDSSRPERSAPRSRQWNEEQSTTIAGQIQLAQFFICGSKGPDLADPFGLFAGAVAAAVAVTVAVYCCSGLWQLFSTLDLSESFGAIVLCYGAAEPSAQGCLF